MTADLSERFSARPGAVEQSWLFDRLVNRGELIIDVAISGMQYKGQSAGVHRFADESGQIGATYGVALARDARGVELQVSPERIDGGLRIRIPAGYIAKAIPPLLVDPVIGAHFSMDTALATRSADHQNTVRVATDGDTYLLVWQDNRQLSGYSLTSQYYDIYGARVSSDGTLLDPTGIEIATGPNRHEHPDVAFGDGTFLVVWEEYGSIPGRTGWDVRGARVNPTDGAVQEPDGIALHPTAGHQQRPRVAFNGNRFLVTWYGSWTGSTGNDIAGARVTSAGVVEDSPPIIISSAADTQAYPRLSANDDTWLVVWSDRRNASNNYNLYAARVLDDGTVPVADQAGVAIASTAKPPGPTNLDSQGNIEVASNGNNWLVVWREARDYYTNGYDLYAARVNSSGAVEEADGFVVAAWGGNETNPRVASDGTDYLVIWSDSTSIVPGSYGGLWVEDDGTVVDPDTNTAEIVGFQVHISGHSDLIYNATTSHFFAPYHQGLGSLHNNIYSNSDDVFYRRFLADGSSVDAERVFVSVAHNAQFYPAVAFDGTNYLVVWSDTRNWDSTGVDIYGARVSPDGTVLDPDGLIICNAAGNQGFPHVAFDGTNFFVVWEDRRPGNSTSDIFGIRIDQSGTRLDPVNQPEADRTGILIMAAGFAQRYPRIAFDNQTYFLVVWQDERNGTNNRDVYGIRIRAADADVQDSDHIHIASQLTHDENPDLAFDGQNFLVVWSDRRNQSTSGYDIYGARVNQQGLVLDPTGKIITGSYTPPPVDLDIGISGDQSYPTILFHGTQYFVAWQDARFSGTTGIDIFSGLVTTDVTAANPNVPVVYSTGNQLYPRASLIAGEPVVLWENRDTTDVLTSQYNIKGARMGPSGAAEYFDVSTRGYNEMRPVIGTNTYVNGLAAYMYYDTTHKTIRVGARTYLGECTEDDHCPPENFCSSGACVPCDTDLHCGPTCAACAAGTFCDGDACLTCDVPAHCGAACEACTGATPQCNGVICVECTDDTHCTSPATCHDEACVVPPDGGFIDAAVIIDAGVPDAPTPDITVVDAGPDASTVDLTQLDLGPNDDAQTSDVQTSDAQTSDARDSALGDAIPDSAVNDISAVDSAAADDSQAVDLARADQTPTQQDLGGSDLNVTAPVPDDGCNCSVTSATPNAPLLLLLGVALFFRKRRSPTPSRKK